MHSIVEPEKYFVITERDLGGGTAGRLWGAKGIKLMCSYTTI